MLFSEVIGVGYSMKLQVTNLSPSYEQAAAESIPWLQGVAP